MKDSYAPGFWCATSALGLITATYFYGVIEAHQIERALVFFNSALWLIGVLALAVLAWSAHENALLKRRRQTQGHTLVRIWDTKVALRKVETVFDRYFWGNYWQPGRTFQEVMGDLAGTPLEKSLEALKLQCQVLDDEIHDSQWHWLDDARELSSVATALARQRYLLDFCDPRTSIKASAGVDREMEVLVYTWSTRLRAFDHQLDALETEYNV
ncbi:NADH:ubiquinone oxidoreductase subunit N [Pseudomonas sp. RIT-To-2]|uniref:NADH:ubiquinone oxidoreductase subunit N n=1 Tax=Pseudomonas sp. RIT-To-2 TaxID=3462541 RepID=UPI0024137F81